MKMQTTIMHTLRSKVIRKCYWLKHYVYGTKADFSIDDARQILDNYSPNPNTSCYVCESRILKNQKKYDCSIIIPTYNNESYLEKCLESVRTQETGYKVQVIVVNDGSTDGTMKILAPYENIKGWTVVHQANKGHSGARNAGLDLVQGKYIMFVDSDDELTQGAVNCLLKKAFECTADIVAGNYIYDYVVTKRLREIRKHTESKVMPKGVLSGFPWGKVYASHLFANLRFPEKFWFEDSINAQIVYALAKEVYTISDIVYKYRINPQGISGSSIGNPKAIDSLYITEALLDDKAKFDLKLDPDDLSYFLRMVRLTYNRTCICSVEIAKCIFVMQRDLYSRFKGIDLVDKSDSDLEKALKEGNFRGYLKAIVK